ncbi:hypothetical protein KSS87_009935 [Heliosperma pusillum]|nr:hypothetical protein KSS87_009935 [Heliosperma pusillum]
MVVLAASIISKSGKALVSRQFMEMSRIRVETLLAAFPKLIGTGKQHTYVETEDVRYVYQPIEALYLLVVTNKQSNILEDLDTLRMLSKLVPEYAYSLDEEGISSASFELTFAFDEVISIGHKENVTVALVKQYCEMESQEEKLHKLVLASKINETKDLMKRKANEIDKSKIEKNKSYMSSMGPGRLESGFSEMSISSSNSNYGPSSALSLSTDFDSYSTKSKAPARPTTAANAPPKGLGMKLGKSQRTNQFLESLKAEGEVIVEDVPPALGKSKAAAPPPTDPITLSVEEKLNVTLKRDGGLSNFDVQGTLALQILEEKDAYIQVQVESAGHPSIVFKTHPNINRDQYSNENILGLKDPNRPFPCNQGGDGVGLLNDTYVSIEYEASSTFDLQNVVISVPLPALREAPNVTQIEGEWRYDSRNSILEWSIVLIDNSNRSGALEFVVPASDSSAFFPISVRFTATNTFSDLKIVLAFAYLAASNYVLLDCLVDNLPFACHPQVVNILPLKGGSPPKFAQRIQLCTENYQVV